MARGFLAGAVTGLALSVGAAAGLSLLMGYPTPPEGVLPAPEVDTTDIADAAAPEPTDAPATPAAAPDDAPATGAAPEPAPEPEPEPAPEPEPDPEPAPEPAAEPEPAPEPAPAPETDTATAPAPAGGVATGEPAAGLTPPPGPDAPISETTDTQTARAPQVAGEGAALTAPGPGAEAGAIDVAQDQPVTGPGDLTESPAAPAVEAALSISTVPAQPPVPELPQEESAFDTPEPATEAAPEPEPATAAPETAENAPATGTAEAPAPAPQDEIAAMTPPALSDEERPAIGTPATSLFSRDDETRSNRLPTIGEAATAEDTPEEGAEADPPIVRYAAEVEAAPGTPRMAVVLIDDGSGPLGPAALDAFPFPVSFAVDPGAPDAAARMQAYREKGFEVLALAALAEGAEATDVEVTLEVALQTLPEVVGVLEAPGGGLQGSRAVSEQVAAYLAASGHGLVMQGEGLNTGTALAQRGGVPAGAVFRDIDGEGQGPDMQRRILDRVALRARQDGTVIALGRLRADTVSALLLWGLQDRANELALVPVSAVLAAE